MKKLRLRLAQLLVPADQVIIPRTLLRQLSGQDEFEFADALADIVDDSTVIVEVEDMVRTTPSELWRETRKQLAEDKDDGE